MKKNAFTLFELLVSISIIGLLMAVVIVAYGPVQKSARDNRRKSDLEKIRMALEMYKMDVGNYPVNVGLLSSNYLSVWPNGPKGIGDIYCYSPIGSAAPYFKYNLYANLELVAAGGLSCGGATYNYTVTQQ